MSLSWVARRRDKRVILWKRLCGRVLLVLFLAPVLFLAGLIFATGFDDAAVSETWWDDHLFILLLGFVGLALAVGVGWPLARRLRLPLERLPDLDAPPGPASSESLWSLLWSWRYFFAVLGFIGLGLFFYAEENWRGQRAWERYKVESAARGDPLELSAIVPRRVLDARNFALTPFLAPLFGFRLGTNTNAAQNAWNFAQRYDFAASWVKSPKVPRFNSWVTAQVDLPTWHAAFLKGTNFSRSADAELITTNFTTVEAGIGVLAALSECEPIIEELRDASRLPGSRFNLDYDNEMPASILLPHLRPLRRMSEVLRLRACAELALGGSDDAFEDVSLMLRLTDALKEEPVLISHLVRLAQLQLALQSLAEGLARHQWSEPQLRAFQEQLAHFDFITDERRVLQGERVLFGGGTIEYLRRSTNRFQTLQSLGRIGTGQQGEFDIQAAILAAVPSGWFSFEQLNYSRMFADFVLSPLDVSAHRVNPAICRKTNARLEVLFREPWTILLLRHRYLSSFLLPSISGTIRKTAFAQTGAELAALACTLERYRLAHGQFPNTLDSLVPQFLNKLPHDLITSQPLKYRPTHDGQYLLYSVGWNETDDGGVVGLTKDEHVNLETGDWLWRLPASP